MNAVIIEDEKLSADHLTRLLNKIDPEILVTGIFDSVSKTIGAFRSGLEADLLFVDIHLADGISFDIFSEVSISTPIIFTTAYNEYAIRAFKLNSVDYLLKPVGLEDLKNAVDKFRKYSRKDYSVILENIVQAYQTMNKQYKSRFMIKLGENITSVKTEDIAHFVHEDGIVLLATTTNHLYPVDFTLDQLETMIDPAGFFRINRKVIVQINSIQKTGSYFNSRLKVTSAFLHDDNAVVSRERVGAFKEWLGN
jgi:DNA-binding LytR/AlgR family response regulator